MSNEQQISKVMMVTWKIWQDIKNEMHAKRETIIDKIQISSLDKTLNLNKIYCNASVKCNDIFDIKVKCKVVGAGVDRVQGNLELRIVEIIVIGTGACLVRERDL